LDFFLLLFSLFLFLEAEKRGENRTSSWLLVDGFAIPPNSRYFNGDWTSISSSPQVARVVAKPFDLVVLDPPWRNKFVRRVKRQKRSYETFDNDELLRVKGIDFMAPGCLVAVWCPPTERQIEWVTSVLMPAWECESVATWFWFKVL
jgi:hypothetical protein